MIKRPFLAFLAFSLGMVLTLTACSSNRTDTSNNNQQAGQSAKSSVSIQSATNESESTTPKEESSRPVLEGKSQAAETEVLSIQTKTVENKSLEKTSTGGDTLSTSTDARVKLIFNNEQVIVKIDDNPTSRDFLSLLPLTLTFEDYAGTEKISYLPRKLSTQDAPSGFDPSVGDLTLYAPWGNLAIFYKDFRYSNGLIKLGHIESGIEKLASMRGNFIVHIEQVK